jgi:hypothetical protein
LPSKPCLSFTWNDKAYFDVPNRRRARLRGPFLGGGKSLCFFPPLLRARCSGETGNPDRKRPKGVFYLEETHAVGVHFCSALPSFEGLTPLCELVQGS